MPNRFQYLHLVFVLVAATMPMCLAGCGSQKAGATANASSAADSMDPTMSAAADSGARKSRPKLRPGARTIVLARAGDRPYDKTFDDLRFDMAPGAAFHRSMLTKPIEAMSGQRIRIRGYILPGPQRNGIKTFVLVRDNQECCFGQGAALYDCILVDMQPGKSAEFTIRPIAVEGTFEVHEFSIGGKCMAIYHMDAESAG